MFKLVAFPNSEAMVNAALQGKVHAFVADYPSGYYRLLLADAISRFRSVDALYTESIHAAVLHGATDLLEFVDTGLEKITQADLERIRDAWLIPAEPLSPLVWPVAITSGVIVVLAAFGFHYWSLRLTVRRRTDDLTRTVNELAVANHELERLAGIDTLTGVANRRSFHNRAVQEIERVKRYARPLSLIVFDLDYFKAINDHFGHVAGDSVLRSFVDAVDGKLRETDYFARLGGDEFVVLLPETSRVDAVVIAERILLELRSYPFEHRGKRINVSCSAGVVEFKGDGSIQDWIERADKQLYRSKSQGRARVISG